MPKRYPSLRERLDANSKPMWLVPGFSKPCRIWNGELNSGGYGRLSVRGRYYTRYSVKGKKVKARKVKKIAAHRLSLAEALGVPVWRLNNVCHECDVKPCIEPSHLRSKTQRLNMLDCVARGRHNSQTRAPVIALTLTAPQFIKAA